MAKPTNIKHILKSIGPGLLFASSAIGTSHLVLSTRAGAHHGMFFFWIIAGALLFKYPFFEFGPRYANATGNSLLIGYKRQGKWAVAMYMLIIAVAMFAVTGAVSAVCGGLLSTMMGMSSISMPVLVGGILTLTAILLLVGRYTALDNFIKLISVVLLVSVCIAFFAVLFKGQITPTPDFQSNDHLFEGAALALMVSLIGWMPSGLEASAMHSIWSVEKVRATNYHPSLKESLFDFNLGYIFTAVLAIMFLTIGAFTVYGSGKLLDGNSTAFSNKLLDVFTSNLGSWSYPVIAVAAFGTIYGTLITAWDAFTRSFSRCIRIFKFDQIEQNEEQQNFLSTTYNIVLILIGIGGFLLFTQFTSSMIKMLEFATIFSFVTAPIIGFLNLRAIQSQDVPHTHRPSKTLLLLAYVGLVAMTLFTLYYLMNMDLGGH